MKKQGIMFLLVVIALFSGVVKSQGMGTICTGAIGDFVWFDANGNGIQDVGELGINGVEVELYNLYDTKIATITTTGGPLAQPGYYQFTGLCKAPYTVKVNSATLPVGYQVTLIGVGDDPNQDSDNPEGAAVELPDSFAAMEGIDFGYRAACSGRIGDFVWMDANGNGLQDAGELGMNGVNVEFFDAGGNLIGLVTTFTGGPLNQPGYYQFEGLCGGNYFVGIDEATVPGEYVPTAIGVGSDPEEDSNNPAGSGVVLADNGSLVQNIDFGYRPTCVGTIGDFVWVDLNRNGLQDSDEMGLNGIGVELYDDGLDLIRTVTTFTGGPSTQPGYYRFDGLCAGTYKVAVNAATVPAGYEPTIIGAGGDSVKDSDNPNGSSVFLATNQAADLSVDFGFKTVCDGKIGDFVWFDANHNGLQEMGEIGINGVTVKLYDTLLATTMTATTFTGGPLAQAGYYQFEGLCPGQYKVSVKPDTLPANYVPTLLGMGSDINLDSNDPAGAVLTLTIGAPFDTSIDFGYAPGECGICDGKVSMLTLKYLGGETVNIKVYQQKVRAPVFEGLVGPNDPLFSFTGVDKKGTLGTNIYIHVNGQLQTSIHTSCSQPIAPDMVFGKFQIVYGESRNGGPLCPLDDSGDCDHDGGHGKHHCDGHGKHHDDHKGKHERCDWGIGKLHWAPINFRLVK